MSGRLRLAATGVQDQWLTGDPQFSYFLMNFRRHTKFAIDHVESQFDGDRTFGKILECRVPNDKGDLIRNFTLKVTLDYPKPDTLGNNRYWSPSIISHLIEYAELVIGGQTIERLTGEYIYMHQQLYNTDDDVTQTLYFLNGHGGTTLVYGGKYDYFLAPPFFFYRNPSLAIPTCALTKQLVEVRIKTRPLDQLVRNISSTDPTDTIADVTASINKMSLDTEFAYVTPEERGYLMSRPLDYVITQVQLARFKMKAGENKKSVMLNFQHPVKEMFFVSQNIANGNIPHYYNGIVDAELRFNNEVVFKRDGLFLAYEQALKYHVNSPSALEETPEEFNGTNALLGPSKFGIYSFSLQPEMPYPTGQVNMSRITHKLFTIEIDPVNSVLENNTRVYAINYNLLRIESGLAGLKF